MISVEVLLSTVNQRDDSFVSKINIDNKCNYRVINQVFDIAIPYFYNSSATSFFKSVNDRGLSKSRNLCLSDSTSDICLLCDDDVIYRNNLYDLLKEAYDYFKDADIIVFKGKSMSSSRKFVDFGDHPRRLGLFDLLKISSVLISFKRNSIKIKDIKFDERFGSGSMQFTAGEDNIFLIDCWKNNLKVYYYPNLILEKKFENSLWFSGYNEKFFYTKGAVYYRMFGLLGCVFYLLFLIKKHSLYKEYFSFSNALLVGFKGINDFRK